MQQEAWAPYGLGRAWSCDFSLSWVAVLQQMRSASRYGLKQQAEPRDEHSFTHAHTHCVEVHALKLTVHCRSTDTSCINRNSASGPQWRWSDAKWHQSLLLLNVTHYKAGCWRLSIISAASEQTGQVISAPITWSGHEPIDHRFDGRRILVAEQEMNVAQGSCRYIVCSGRFRSCVHTSLGYRELQNHSILFFILLFFLPH